MLNSCTSRLILLKRSGSRDIRFPQKLRSRAHSFRILKSKLSDSPQSLGDMQPHIPLVVDARHLGTLGLPKPAERLSGYDVSEVPKVEGFVGVGMGKLHHDLLIRKLLPLSFFLPLLDGP